MEKRKEARKRLFSLFLVFAMALTSVSVPSVTAEAAKTAKVKKVQITNPKKKKVTLNKGKTLQIKVKVTPKNVKNKKVTYKSSKKKIASVSKKGKVKGLKIGTAKITVTSKANRKKKATLTVKVVTPVSKVTVSPAAATIDAGASTTLKASVAPKNAYNKKVKWTTSDNAVATVASNGVVTGVKAGTATITATAADGSKKKASCVVTVKAVDVTPPAQTAALESIAVTKAPDKTEYVKGDLFDPAGMEVTATYSDQTKKALDSKAYQLSPSVETPLKTSDSEVTVSYTEGGITKTATTPITVKAKPTVKEIAVKTMPTKKKYTEGDVFDPAGMEIEATLSDGTKKLLEEGEGGYTYSKEPLEVTVGAETSNVTISYVVSSSKTLTAEVPVTVEAKNPLKSIAVTLKQTMLPREGASFTDDDVEVTATFEDNTTKKISVADCSVVPEEFTKTTTEATVSYWYGGIKKECKVTGFKVGAYSEKYTFEDKDTMGILVKRENENGDAIPTEEYAKDVQPVFVDNGIEGKALKMDGKYGLRLDKIAGTESKSYSVSMWVKPEEMKENRALIISTASQFGKGDAGDESWCALAGNSTKDLKLWSYGGDYTHAIAVKAPITSGADAPWTHIVMTVDGTKKADGTAPGEHDALGTLYVNGRKIGSGNVRNEKGKDMKTYFGVSAWKNDGYHKGLVDELVFTNEVLTEEDAQNYYLEGIVNSGNTIKNITAVSADDGEEITVPYGTTLADVKEKLSQIEYKAEAGEEEPVSLKPVSDTLTVDNYGVTTTGEVNTTVKLQAPDGYLFNMDGNKSVAITRNVKIKISNPIIIESITASAATVQVPFGSAEDAIKEELAKLTFTVETSDDSEYEITNAAAKWTLAKAGEGYTATFTRDEPRVGYKYADNLAQVTVTVTQKPAISITGLTVEPNAINVPYNTSEAGVKAELAGKVRFKATVASGEEPVIANAAELWTIASYNGETAGEYTAKATVAAPTGYVFANTVNKEVTVKVTVDPKGEHVLGSLFIEKAPTKTAYIEGDKFDKAGMVVKAIYKDGESEDVTSKIEIEDKELKLSDTSVTVSYSEGEGTDKVTQTAAQEISVVKVEEGMAVHYDFENSLNDTKGGTAATMATNKTMVDNTNTPTYVDGLKGKGVRLGNDSNIIRFGSIVKNANFTINIWANPKTLDRNFAPLLNGTESAAQSRVFNIYTCCDGKSKDIRIHYGSEKTEDVKNVWDTGKWTMVTWVNSDQGTHVYMNGKEIYANDSNKVEVNKLKKIFIGGSGWDDVFDSVVDEVSIYNSPLSVAQVQKLYASVPKTITAISTNAPDGGLKYAKSVAGEDDTVIQAALKNLKISATVPNHEAPAFANGAAWTLTPAYNGQAGTYTAKKEIEIPEGYVAASGLKTTLEIPIVVEDAELKSIAVTTAPSKLEYITGEKFDPAGMKVTASYGENGAITRDVTESVTFTNDTAIAPGEGENSAKQTVTISYKEGEGEAVTATQEITVYTPKAGMIKARTAYYTFDDTLENAVDTSKSGKVVVGANNGFPTEDTTKSLNYSEESKHGKSVLFNSTTETEKLGIKLPDTIDAGKKDFTLNLWVRPESGSKNWGVIVAGLPANWWEKQLLIYVRPKNGGESGDQDTNDQTFNLQGTDGAGPTNLSFSALSQWAMLTWVNTADGAKFYINGEEQTVTQGLGTTTGINNLYIGIAGWPDFFKGYIDEVSLYDKSLTEEQVKLLHDKFDETLPEAK